MFVLTGGNWTDGYLDEHRESGTCRVQVSAWLRLRRIDDLYFVPDRDWRRVSNYVREIGTREVWRKIRSRLAERGRNEKVLAVGAGRIIEPADGERAARRHAGALHRAMPPGGARADRPPAGPRACGAARRMAPAGRGRRGRCSTMTRPTSTPRSGPWGSKDGTDCPGSRWTSARRRPPLCGSTGSARPSRAARGRVSPCHRRRPSPNGRPRSRRPGGLPSAQRCSATATTPRRSSSRTSIHASGSRPCTSSIRCRPARLPAEGSASTRPPCRGRTSATTCTASPATITRTRRSPRTPSSSGRARSSRSRS